MNEQTTEKFANLLGVYATTGNSAGLQKEAAENGLIKSAISSLMYMPLLGAGIGGASGYFGTSGKEKKKQRNAMYGALTGGLGGFAGAALTPVVREMLSAKAAPAAASEPKGDGGKKEPPGSVYGGPNSTPVGGAVVGAGAVAGGFGGQRAGGQLYDRVTGTKPDHGSLARLADASGKATKGKTGPAAKNEYGVLKKIFEAHNQRGQPVAASLDALPAVPPRLRPAPTMPRSPETLPGFASGHPSSVAAMTDYNNAVAAYNNELKTWRGEAAAYNTQLKQFQAARAGLAGKLQDAEAIVRTQSLGGTPAEQARRAAILDEMIRNNKGAPSGRTLTDVKPHLKGTTGRRIARVGGGGVGAVAGGAITNLLGRILGNVADRTLGNVPAPTKQEK
jgi:hypothetical protein